MELYRITKVVIERPLRLSGLARDGEPDNAFRVVDLGVRIFAIFIQTVEELPKYRLALAPVVFQHVSS